jgi:RNA polymerase sigma-70 factor (ECF subfamily)
MATFEADASDPPQAQPSFEFVYATHAARVYRFCLSQIGQTEAAQDITHEAFMKAFVAYERVSPEPETVQRWLLTIARNCCMDYHRQRRRWRRLLARLQAAHDSPPDVEALAHQRSELDRASAALLSLKPRERELIGLRVAADLTYRQVAEIAGVSEEAAKAATRRTLLKLRSTLEDRI